MSDLWKVVVGCGALVLLGMTVDMKDIPPQHLKIIEKIGEPVEIFRAASAECNAEFVSQWSVGSVAGMYRRSKG